MHITDRETSVVPFPRAKVHGAAARAGYTPNGNPEGEQVYLIEGRRSAREDISAGFTENGIKVLGFPSAAEYLGFERNDRAACVVLNLLLPDLSGLELQRQLAEKAHPPVIFICDRCEIASSVCAMKAGAIDFLATPLDWPALIAGVKAAFAQDRRHRRQRAEQAHLQERFSLLTPREREVLPLIVGGLLNKQAAAILGISEVTLQIHRSQVMRKMQAESFADLVRMSVTLRIRYWRESQPGLNTGTGPR